MKLKQLLSLTLALSMAFSVAACGSTSSSSSAAPVSTASGSASETSDSSLLCSDEPLTLTAHIHWNNEFVLNDDMPIPKEAAKMTNITLKGTASEMDTDSAQSFNLMITRSPLPDLVGGTLTNINTYGMEGAFIPLNDLIEQYAPNIKAILDENPDIKAAITAEDGNIYQIPFIYGSSLAETWFIRQDWLDAVDMPVPQTVEELHDTLAAFLDKDANGNGQRDEIGYFIREYSLDNRLTPLLSLFGVSDYWHVDENGKVGIGSYSEEYKDAIKEASRWYAEGLIDPEIFTRDITARETLFSANNGGVTHDWLPSTSAYNRTMQESVPGFKLVGMLPPTDVNGDRWEVSSRDRLTGNGWAISVDNEHPEESMKYMNFWFTDTGRRLTTYGIEGETYNMVDGKPVYVDSLLNGDVATNIQIMRMGGMIEQIAFLHDDSYENFTMSEEGAEAKEMYLSSGVLGAKYPKIPALSFTEEENELISSKYPACRAYMLEQLQKWTFDGSTIDSEFDDYMSTLSEMGMDEIVTVYQNAYDRLMSNA